LIDTLSAIQELFSYMLVEIEPNQRTTRGTFQAHKDIVRSLASGEPEKAKEINRAHIENIVHRLAGRYKKGKGLARLVPQCLHKKESVRDREKFSEGGARNGV
jgi:DNA-binding FadR family transcriptional regulator